MPGTLRRRALAAAALLCLTLPLLPPAAAASPTACFSVTPTVGSTLTVFGVDASCSTHPTTLSALLQVRWDWEDDGAWDTAFSITKTATHQYAAAGTYDIRVEVADPVSGDTATTTRTVLVRDPLWRTSYGHITIATTASTTAVDYSSYQATGWTCNHSVSPSLIRAWCTPPAPGTPYDGWQCTGLAVSAVAPNVGSAVRGSTSCTDTGSNSSPVDTADVFGPNGSGSASAPLLVNIVLLECIAKPTSVGNLFVRPFTVTCSEP